MMVCPQRHVGVGAGIAVMGVGQVMTDLLVLAALVCGRCPACPAERLIGCAVRIGRADVPAHRCRCCGAAWQHGLDWWVILQPGQLVSA